MTEFPEDFSWTKRLTKYALVRGITEAKVWSLAADTDCYDMHQFLDEAEAELTPTQRQEMKS